MVSCWYRGRIQSGVAWVGWHDGSTDCDRDRHTSDWKRGLTLFGGNGSIACVVQVRMCQTAVPRPDERISYWDGARLFGARV